MKTGNKTDNIREIDSLKKELEIEKWVSQKSEAAFRALYKELKLKSEIIKSHDQLKSHFVANVAHEIKNPLFIIKEGLALVLDGTTGEMNNDQKNIIQRAKNNVDRLLRLVTNLLEISKIEAGKMELNKEKIDIKSFINEIIQEYKTLISKKRLVFEKDISKDAGFAFADGDKLREVVINLLDNAIKYTPVGGNINIKLSGDKKEVCFEVYNSGPCISKENFRKIFDKFERITSEKQEGTGLGLPIAKDIIELHKGRIWIESPVREDSSLGAYGSKFAFILPRDLK